VAGEHELRIDAMRRSGMVATVDFDHGDPGISDDLRDWGHRLQAESPIAYSEAHGGFYLITRHEDIIAVTRDTESFSSARGITIPPLSNPVPSIPAESDEPMHRHYRAVLQAYLTPSAVRRYEDDIRALVTEAIDSFIEKGEADLVTDLAAQVPTMATASVFGFNRADAIRFDSGFRAVVEAAGADVDTHVRVVGDFMTFLKDKVDERRTNPADDVISSIVTFDADGRKFTEEECLGLLWSTAGAATDTTRHAIGFALYDIHQNPEVREKLIADPDLIPGVVEESLRLDAPAFSIARSVVRDVTINGVDLKPGDRVLLVYGFANRDNEIYPNPDEFVLGRPNVMQHCTFGKGIHTCVGMHLAKLEVRIVLEQVLRRLPDYQLTDVPAGPRLAGGLMWGFETLPAKFAPGALSDRS
jgi:cytochrome P450